MMVDVNKLSSFSVSENKEICFSINGKSVIYEIPFALLVNKKEKKLYIGKTMDKEIEITDKDIEMILGGDDSIIVSACTDFVWSLISKNKYCKE